jgi:glycosyltransferase involved in cell wall biosynthesis
MVLVGPFEQTPGPLSAGTLEWAQRHGVGFRHDIRPFLAAADVLVLPSHREGFPGAPLQAGAMGLPVLATDICGCNEIVVDGVTGLLVKPRDVEGLRDAMARLAADPPLRRKMGLAARNRVIENFGRQRVWNALLSLYADAVDNV